MSGMIFIDVLKPEAINAQNKTLAHVRSSACNLECNENLRNIECSMGRIRPRYENLEHSRYLNKKRSPSIDLLVNLDKLSDFVFFGQKPKRPLSNMAMAMLMRRIGRDKTVHGFRSAFRDWCGDETNFPREVAEAALAHIVSGVEGTYRRKTDLGKRRRLMQSWAEYCYDQEIQ